MAMMFDGVWVLDFDLRLLDKTECLNAFKLHHSYSYCCTLELWSSNIFKLPPKRYKYRSNQLWAGFEQPVKYFQLLLEHKSSHLAQRSLKVSNQLSPITAQCLHWTTNIVDQAVSSSAESVTDAPTNGMNLTHSLVEGHPYRMLDDGFNSYDVGESHVLLGDNRRPVESENRRDRTRAYHFWNHCLPGWD